MQLLIILFDTNSLPWESDK